MFGGDYFSQSIWSKTANAPSAAMAAGRPPNGVKDEFLSISRIGVVTKENLREGDFPLQMQETHSVTSKVVQRRARSRI
jgi:hypothetical protein